MSRAWQPVVMPHPADEQTDVRVFPNASAASNHLRDHVLTAPESAAWELISPQVLDTVDLANADARWQCADRLQADDAAVFSTLYEAYSSAIQQANRAASRLGWYARRELDSGEQVCISLGTTGVLTVIQSQGCTGVVQTAFVPGQGSAATVAQSRLAERAALPRESLRDSSAASLRRRTHFSDRVRERYAKDWNPRERLYYQVFRPAIQFVRSLYHLESDAFGRVPRDYALLKTVLPRMKRLKLTEWLGLHEECAAGLTEVN